MENLIKKSIVDYSKSRHNIILSEDTILIQRTKKEIPGDFTVNVFPLLKYIKINPELLAYELADYLAENIDNVYQCDVIKGFLNIHFKSEFWVKYLVDFNKSIFLPPAENKKNIMIEFSSPNTNKPLHLGHIRNNLLGDSISRILKAVGHKVIKVNLVNDRGIHICKSMLAWKKWGKNQTPESTGLKGDKLAGNFYVKFETENQKEAQILQGEIEKNKQNTALFREAQDMLIKWEEGDRQTILLWKKMNNWVYKGFEQTYKKLGITFDKTYYESDTYKSGKNLVTEGLKKGIFFKQTDGAVCVDLKDVNLDEKVLLRSDGTSVYITQDLGTAHQRFSEFNIDEHIYVVGNEQIYHFQVLKAVLKKLDFDWAEKINHLSYGMVELPDGKMKSREGKVVDADDLIDEMIYCAQETTKALGKLEDYTEAEKKRNHEIIALGALKYFILKVDPKRNMMFNPEESIDFNGNTGPFIQYTYARIRSILRKADKEKVSSQLKSLELNINQIEIELIKNLSAYNNVLLESSEKLSPSLIANYTYSLAKEFNQYYHEHPILKESDENIRSFRLLLSLLISEILKYSMNLLGIEMPEKM
ncbi:MAG: arginine--tRNA ligase [Bacteroidota bacterium]